MDIRIRINDLMTEKAELLLNNEFVEPFAHVVRRPSHFDDTFDIDLTVIGIAITPGCLAFHFPSGSFDYFFISSDTYHKIEVM